MPEKLAYGLYTKNLLHLNIVARRGKEVETTFIEFLSRACSDGLPHISRSGTADKNYF